MQEKIGFLHCKFFKNSKIIFKKIFSGDNWQFFWVNREWMTSYYDRYKFKEGQLICHFRNDYELTRKDCLIKNHKKYRKNPENNNK